MIKSFKDFTTRDIATSKNSARTRRLPTQIIKRAAIKLVWIDTAKNITDLETPPGNKLEALSGKLKGFYSIRINKQWRIIFQWVDNDAHQVQIIDYH